MLKKITVAISLLLSMSAYAEPETKPVCFKEQVIDKNYAGNVQNPGSYAVDIEYVRIDPSKKCRLELDSSLFGTIGRTENLQDTFKNLGEINTYGNFTILAIPTDEKKVHLNRNSKKIVKINNTGLPSEIVRFDLDGTGKVRNFSLAVKMYSSKDNSEKPEAIVIPVSGKVLTSERNMFLFAKDDYIIYVHFYPVKFAYPKKLNTDGLK